MSLKKIAEMVGVSPSTVSRVLNAVLGIAVLALGLYMLYLGF